MVDIEKLTQNISPKIDLNFYAEQNLDNEIANKALYSVKTASFASDQSSPRMKDKEYQYNNQVQELRNGQQLLIIIDGTWAEAKRMIKESPTLVDMCQQVQFTADNESIYDIVRKEPEKHCISTLEACSHALTLLEPEERRGGEAKEWLEGSMKYMVETKMNVHDLRNGIPEPRFARPGAKTYERNKRRFEIKEELFKNKKE